MDIVDRLRRRNGFFLNGGIWLMGSGPDGDCQDAADEIERLRGALKPFARFADMIDGDPAARPTGDACPLTLDYSRINDGTQASLGHCQQARAVLKGE